MFFLDTVVHPNQVIVYKIYFLFINTFRDHDGLGQCTISDIKQPKPSTSEDWNI